MSSVRSHPRRRPAALSMTPSLAESFQGLSIRKGSTFHSPTLNSSELYNPLACSSAAPPLMPGRSATCPKTLEDLLIGAGERRATDLLARVDKAIARQSALSNILNEPEVLPVPRFMLESSSLSQRSVSRKKRSRLRNEQQHNHASDSGLGTSLTGSDEKTALSNRTFERSVPFTSAINKSGSAANTKQCLSAFAQDQIHRHILQPILEEQSLKEFHPLVRDIPRRIGDRDITNLRDLEKTLIFLAPDFSRSPAAYQSFCETTIRCLHLTVGEVHQSAQCLPSDRPYTNHYFLDLVEQIRRYATILAATREKQAKGKALDETDVTMYVSLPPDWWTRPVKRLVDESWADWCRKEQIQLHGPPGSVQLVRQREGKTISIVTGQVLSTDPAATSSKRPMHDIADDDSALRSMARRKKNELPKTYTCKSTGCRKEFKRPCDLTKHIKTHERPWKCTERSCKFHAIGFSTDKECQRHVNDKHLAEPTYYKCLFAKDGCPYTSKRESNAKQHMEKSHGWTYVRSKQPGKAKLPVTRIPAASESSTSDSAVATPLTPAIESPSIYASPSDDGSSRNSMAPPSTDAGPSTFTSPAEAALPDISPEFADHFNVGIFGAPLSSFEALPLTPSWSNNHRLSADVTDNAMASGSSSRGNDVYFESAITPEYITYKTDHGGDFDLFGSLQYQQPTPALSTYNVNNDPPSGSLNGMYTNGSNEVMDTFSPHLFPGAQGNVTLTTPNFYDNMDMDEGYVDIFKSKIDFQLYGMPSSSDEPLFHDEAGFGNMGSQFGQYDSQAADSKLLELFPELQGQI